MGDDGCDAGGGERAMQVQGWEPVTFEMHDGVNQIGAGIVTQGVLRARRLERRLGRWDL